jgi:hypothetical protein
LRAVICEEAVERRDSTREKGGRRLGEWSPKGGPTWTARKWWGCQDCRAMVCSHKACGRVGAYEHKLEWFFNRPRCHRSAFDCMRDFLRSATSAKTFMWTEWGIRDTRRRDLSNDSWWAIIEMLGLAWQEMVWMWVKHRSGIVKELIEGQLTQWLCMFWRIIEKDISFDQGINIRDTSLRNSADGKLMEEWLSWTCRYTKSWIGAEKSSHSSDTSLRETMATCVRFDDLNLSHRPKESYFSRALLFHGLRSMISFSIAHATALKLTCWCWIK